MPEEIPDPTALDPKDQRAADADRQRVAERLRLALDEGRLDLNEYDERVRKVYGAKTYGDLDGLLVDLPLPVAEEKAQLARREQTRLEHERHVRAEKRRKKFREILGIWSGFGGAAVFFVGLWILTWVMGDGDAPSFWPAWVLGIWGLCALGGTWSKLMNDD